VKVMASERKTRNGINLISGTYFGNRIKIWRMQPARDFYGEGYDMIFDRVSTYLLLVHQDFTFHS
jgi:hypothetical protein